MDVCLTFDLDAESVQVRKKEDLVRISKGQFAIKKGVPRILSLLSKKEIQATFFVCGWVAETYPKVIEGILEEGHEIAAHSYLHENLGELSFEEEVRVHEKTSMILNEFTEEVLGFRAPYFEMSENTLGLLASMGYLYDSSLMDDDHPYVFPVKGIDEEGVKGAEKNLVELPVEWYLDDWVLFEIHQYSPKAVMSVWKAEFDSMVGSEEAYPPEYFNITSHPACIGRFSRIEMLSKFVDHMTDNGANYTRCIDLVRRVSEQKTG